MSSIPLGLSAYKRADLPPVTLKNFFYERTPSNLEDQVVLIPRPRLKQFALAGAGPMNGLYRKGGVIGGAILALSNDQLYKVTQTGVPGVGTATLIGTLPGPGRMSAEGNSTVVVMARGGGAYQTDGASITQITMPDSIDVTTIDTLNSYFLFGIFGSGRFYWSAIGGTTVDALDYATAESQPDVLIGLKVIGDELWLFGRLSIEVWQPTGDLDLPFQRIGGRIFGIGCTARDTIAKLNVNGSDTVCWVGTDRKIYRTAPNPVRISDHGMEERLRRATPETLYGAAYSWTGHDFYVLHIPGEGSFAYDVTTGFWDELTSYARSLFRGAVAAVGPNTQPLFGDDTGGVIWEFVTSQRTDGTDPVVYEFTGLLENPGAPIRCNNVLLDCTTGLTPDPESDPAIEMAWSADNGEVFGDWFTKPLGRQGRRLTQVIWAKLGQIARPGRLFKWRTTEPITVRKARYNESYK